MSKSKMICAVLVSDTGDILPHTCQPTISQCEEYCERFFPAWNVMQKLGAKVVQAEIVLFKDIQISKQS